MIEPGLLFSAGVALAVSACVHRGETFRLRWRPTRHTWAAVGAGGFVVALSGAALLAPQGSALARISHRIA